jgi:DNA-binding helix-hairpin-helix protein with protein kinase domain
MTNPDPNKIQQASYCTDISHHIQYLMGVADSVGYIILSRDLMKQIADSHAWLNRKYEGYRADEKRREEIEKRRKAKIKAAK